MAKTYYIVTWGRAWKRSRPDYSSESEAVAAARQKARSQSHKTQFVVWKCDGVINKKSCKRRLAVFGAI